MEVRVYEVTPNDEPEFANKAAQKALGDKIVRVFATDEAGNNPLLAQVGNKATGPVYILADYLYGWGGNGPTLKTQMHDAGAKNMIVNECPQPPSKKELVPSYI